MVTGMVCSDFSFFYFMRKIMNLSIEFKKEHNEKLGATRIVDILKDMSGSDFLIKMSFQP